MEVEGSSGQPASHPFTCNSCRVAFRTGTTQRTHMQSDWHRYNLKRRVASLPPLSAETFNEKVLANQATAAADAAKQAFEKTCDACSKSYSSINSYESHLKSQRHRQNEARAKEPKPANKSDEAKLQRQASKIEEEGNVEMKDADEEEARISKRCLFCRADFEDVEANVAHMKLKHGTFIPERNYLVDLPGLINYLYAKIEEGNICLSCGTEKRTAEACRSHMMDLGHCMIAYSTEEDQVEIGDFYDFRSTYSDAEGDDWEDEDEEGAANTKEVEKEKKIEKEVNADGKSEDGWETASDSDESVASDDIGPLYEDKIVSRPVVHHTESRSHKSAEGFHSHAHSSSKMMFHDDVELHLPNGMSLGSRKYRHIWRQRLPPRQRTPELDDPNYTDTDSDEDVDMEGAGEGSQSQNQLSRRERRDEQFQRGKYSAPTAGQLITRRDQDGLQGVTTHEQKTLLAAAKRNQRNAHIIQKQTKAAYEKKRNSQKHYRDPLLQ